MNKTDSRAFKRMIRPYKLFERTWLPRLGQRIGWEKGERKRFVPKTLGVDVDVPLTVNMQLQPLLPKSVALFKNIKVHECLNSVVMEPWG